jgi:hypothetical protein
VVVVGAKDVTVVAVLARLVGATVTKLVVELDPINPNVVEGARDVVDNDVDSVGRVVSGNVVEANISGNVVGVNVDVGKLLVDDSSKLLEVVD